MLAKANHFSIFVTYCICTILPLCVSAQKQSYDEYALKTAFLYRSLHYIEWPAIPTNNADTSLTICAVSNDAFSSTIESLHLKAVKQHKIIVKTFDHYRQMHDCQVVYIGKNADINKPYYGQLDDFRIYNRALSGTEVFGLYQGIKP